eukprot:gene11247-17302_t
MVRGSVTAWQSVVLVTVTWFALADAQCDQCVKYCGLDLINGSNRIGIHDDVAKYILGENCEWLSGYSERYPNVSLEDWDVQDITGSTDFDGVLSVLKQVISSLDRTGGNEVLLMDYEWIAPLAHHLKALSEPLVQHIKPKFVPRDRARNVLGIPMRANQLVVFYRRDLFDRYNLTYHVDSWETWEETVLALQGFIQDERNDPSYRALMYSHNGGRSRLSAMLATLLSGNGGGKIIEDDGTVSINNPAAIKTLEMLKR